MKRLSAPVSAPAEVNITTDDLKGVLIDNPDLIDFDTWKTLFLRSAAVKSLVSDLGGEKTALEGEGGSPREKDAEHADGVFKCQQSK